MLYSCASVGSELCAVRTTSPFSSLTGIEFEIIQILQREARRNLSEPALVSPTLLDDEPADPALDLRDAFETNTLAVVDEPETDADADEHDAGGER